MPKIGDVQYNDVLWKVAESSAARLYEGWRMSEEGWREKTKKIYESIAEDLTAKGFDIRCFEFPQGEHPPRAMPVRFTCEGTGDDLTVKCVRQKSGD
jgi:hypothetical protein